jgi:hypothetical protein
MVLLVLVVSFPLLFPYTLASAFRCDLQQIFFRILSTQLVRIQPLPQFPIVALLLLRALIPPLSRRTGLCRLPRVIPKSFSSVSSVGFQGCQGWEQTVFDNSTL